MLLLKTITDAPTKTITDAPTMTIIDGSSKDHRFKFFFPSIVNKKHQAFIMSISKQYGCTINVENFVYRFSCHLIELSDYTFETDYSLNSIFRLFEIDVRLIPERPTSEAKNDLLSGELIYNSK